MFYRNAYILIILLLSIHPTKSQPNVWGIECKTLEVCLKYLELPSHCAVADKDCVAGERFEAVPAGLQQEFERFGRKAVAPLLTLLNDERLLVRERATELLSMSQDLRPEDNAAIIASWRRGDTFNSMLSSRVTTPAFVKEVISALRKNPEQEGYVGQTFSNFRDGAEQTIIAHIECAKGEPCEPNFAINQYQWIDSNIIEPNDVKAVAPRLADAIANNQNSLEARKTALSFFRPRDFLNNKELLAPYALPMLRTLLNSDEQSLRLVSAIILGDYEDRAGVDVLIMEAEHGNVADRHAAIVALASFGASISSLAPPHSQTLG
jgi:HEAT repeat protein